MSQPNIPYDSFIGLWRRPIRTVIDCGASQGQFSRYATRFFPEASFYCFEPLPEPFRMLSTWAAAQERVVRCFPTALGDRTGEGTLHHHVDHSPSSSMLAATEHELALFPQTARQADVTVPITTLDRVLAEEIELLSPEVLLKLDVQGYEDRVLHGASRLLTRTHACLLEVCLDPLYEGQASFETLVRLLAHYGLAYAGNLDQSYGKDGRVMWLDALFLRRS